jgi:hypothetical protein
MRIKNVTKGILAGLTFMSAVSAHAVLSKDIKVAAAALQKTFAGHALTPANCPTVLKAVSNEIYNMAPDYFTNEADIKASQDGSDALSQLFKSRLVLTKRFQDMVRNGSFANRAQLDTCSDQVRIALRTIRDLEDTAGLNSLHKAGRTQAVLAKEALSYPLKDVSFPNFLQNRDIYKTTITKYDKSMIKSGDIFLVKGTMFAAAPISRISKVDNQFTHIAVAYVDDGSLFGPQNKGNVYFIAAEPDYGVQITSFDFFLHDRKARLLHYRYADSSGAENSARLAAKAAKYVAEMSYPRINKKDITDTTMADMQLQLKGNMPRIIPYNFAMDLSRHDALFCSQVVSFSFDHICASDKCETFPKYDIAGQSSIPVSVSQFDVANNSLSKILELQKPDIFSPADIEIDPRFQLLHEWRDYSLIAESRIMDMTITKIMQYIENNKYNFVSNTALDTLAKFGNEMVIKAGMLPDYSPKGYAKGTMLMAFLIKYTGPGQLIVDQIKNLPAAKVKAILLTAGLPEPVAAELSATSRQNLERILSHVSLVTRIANLNEQNIKAKQRVLTMKQIDLSVDYVRNIDCQRYITGQGGPVMYHDFFRRTDSSDRGKQCDTKNTPINALNVW